MMADPLPSAIATWEQEVAREEQTLKAAQVRLEHARETLADLRRQMSQRQGVEKP